MGTGPLNDRPRAQEPSSRPEAARAHPGSPIARPSPSHDEARPFAQHGGACVVTLERAVTLREDSDLPDLATALKKARMFRSRQRESALPIELTRTFAASRPDLVGLILSV